MALFLAFMVFLLELETEFADTIAEFIGFTVAFKAKFDFAVLADVLVDSGY